MKEVCNTETYILKINIMSACTGEKIESIIVDIKNSTINEWFNNFMKEKYNDKLYESDIKIIYDLLQIYSYYDQEIGNKSIEKIDLFENIQEISVSLVFSDPFIYISDIIINPDAISYNIKSYQNLNDYKKDKINELLNMLHNNQLNNFNFIGILYNHIIITKFIAIVLLKIKYCFSQLRRNQLNENFSDDREIVEIAVSQNGLALEYASDELRADREIVIKAISQDGSALYYASRKYRNDREIVGIAVSQHGEALAYASIDLRNDKEIVKIAVLQNGRALQFASKELCDNKEIVKIAISINANTLKFASKNLQADREIVEIAVSQNGYTLEYASINLRNDREIVEIAILQNPRALQFTSKNLQADREIVEIAVSQNGYTLEYASINLRNDKEIVKIAVLQNGGAFYFASKDLRADREIVIIAAINKFA